VAEAVTGLNCIRELYLEELGVPQSNATLTYTLVGPTGTSLVAAQAVTIGAEAGWYEYSLDGVTHLSNPGLYTELWTGTLGSGKVRHQSRFLCLAGDLPIIARWELRHWIARLCDDLTRGTVSANGTSTTAVDTDLDEPDWGGAQIYIYGGTGAGQARTISSSSAGTLTISRAWATNLSASAPVSRYELHRRFTVDDYNDAINLVITERAAHALIPVVDETTTETTSTYEYDLPQGLHWVYQIWHRDTSAASNDWFPLTPHVDFEIVPGRRTLRLPGATTNYRLRLVAQIRPDIMLRDQSYCEMDPAYVAFKAAAHLLQSQISSPSTDLDAMQARAERYDRQAENIRPRTKPMEGAFKL
jgi:hypothetical protein